jgi:protein TonB
MDGTDGSGQVAPLSARPPRQGRRRERFRRSLLVSVALHLGLLITAFGIPVIHIVGPGLQVKEARIEFEEETPLPLDDLPEEELEEVATEDLIPDPELMPIDFPNEEPRPELPPVLERPPNELVFPEIPMTFPRPPPELVVQMEPEVEPDDVPEEIAPVEPVRSDPVLDEQVNRKPRYPAVARRLGLEGTVRVLIRVGVDGVVLGVTILQSSGHRILDEAAVSAIESWILQPGTLGGVAVEMEFEHEIVFTLRE